MKIWNGTTHNIALFREEDTRPNPDPTKRNLVAVEGAQPFFVLPPGKPLNAQRERVQMTSACGLPASFWKVLSVDSVSEIFPESDPKIDFYICSSIYAEAHRQVYRFDFVPHGHLLISLGAVYSQSGEQIGALVVEPR